MALPKHVAVIMDGNGRWAKARFLPRTEGHRRGIQSLRTLVRCAREKGIEHLTVFAFSSENWSRPQEEVSALMSYFVMALQKEAIPLSEADIQLHVVGNTQVMSEDLRAAIAQAEATTAHCRSMTLNICTNYGGRWDIVQAARQIVDKGLEIDEKTLGEHMCMPWAGSVDLLIRTGGEKRMSNFLLWQASYAELYFTDVLWPEYAAEDFEAALQWYDGRERRFGRTGDQVRSA